MTSNDGGQGLPRAELGIIGGSGFYALADHLVDVDVPTPYGPPSDPVAVGEVAGRRVAFVARHGRDHRYPPHRIPYQANIWALHALGVRQVLAPCAVGSLRADLGPGALVVPDQLVDRTSGRAQTFYDGPDVRHVPFADPYCSRLRTALLAGAQRSGWPATDGGAMVVIEGPRFSTRAESRWFAANGWSLVNMTGHPEAVLARELGLCYAAVALVTDRDAGVPGAEEAVTQDEVFRVFGENVGRLRDLLLDTVDGVPEAGDQPCGCAAHLDEAPAGGEVRDE